MNIFFSGPSGAGKGILTEMFLKDNKFYKDKLKEILNFKELLI